MSQPSDQDFVTQAFAKLDPIEPSPGLQRQVAQIPITHSKEEQSFWGPLRNIYGALVAGMALAVCGVFTGDLLDHPAADPAHPAAFNQSRAASEDSSPEESKSVVAEAEEEELDELDSVFALAVLSDWESVETADNFDELLFGYQLPESQKVTTQ